SMTSFSDHTTIAQSLLRQSPRATKAATNASSTSPAEGGDFTGCDEGEGRGAETDERQQPTDREDAAEAQDRVNRGNKRGGASDRARLNSDVKQSRNCGDHD